MQEIIKKYEKKIQDKNTKRRKLKIVTAIASLAVVCIVLWALILPGVAMSGQPKCGKEEHRHSDACYTERLTCGQKETDGHTHTDACYQTEKKLICGQEESETHQHTDACYQEEKTLICGKQEEAAHHHTAACYTKELTCGKEEHTHTDECYSDPTADVENEDSWTTTFRHAELGDDWGKNVAAIAETQIGYRESSNNYSVSENREHKGYTRYTAWYGDYYKDWDTAFAAFCIHYAGVPDDAFPTDIKADEWIKKLQEKDWYADKTSEDYQVGDLIFLHKKNQETDTQVGVISKIFEKDGKTYIQTIEGNCDNQVKKNEYAADDENISGYGLLCKAQMKYKADQMAQENAKSEAKARKSAAKKASAPVQTQAADEGTEDSKAVFYSNNENSAEKSVDQRLKVEMSASTPTTTTGHTNSLKVVSTYSQANAPESSSHVCLKVGALPEGVSIEGFKDGVHIVNYQGHDIVLTLTKENGEYYISYDQPAGSTLEFDVQFSSKNGVMPAQSQVTISVDKDKTKAPEGTVGIDSLDDSQTLTWTAKNEWDPVAKKVNGKDSDQTKIDEGKLTGIFKYTIQANSSNGENYGEIWTDYIDVTDTFTLPENISFPSGVKISDNKIVNENGETILAFTDLQGGTITNLTLDGKTVKYTVRVPNSHMENNVPTKEQQNLNLKMELDATKLTIPSDYENKTEQELLNDVINNHVKIQPHAYKDFNIPATEDNATITPTKEPEKIIVNKTVDDKSKNQGVKAGDSITYTLSVKNNGTSDILVKDANETYYKVTDHLPKYLTLTEKQISDLKKKSIDVSKNSDGTYILSWIPSQDNIKAGEIKSISFDVTVKDANDQVMNDLRNGSNIPNQAQYKGNYSPWTNVTYHKGETTVNKFSNANGELKNGDEVIYTIEVTNPTNIPVQNEVINDELPKGLEFISCEIGGTTVTESKENVSLNGHYVDFTKDGQKLQWKVNRINGNETLRFTYKCKINTDKTDGTTKIKNSVNTNSGGSDNTDIHVKDPISIEKNVDENTNTVYQDKQVFNYSITLKNDKDNPSTEKNQELVDVLPSGMLLLDDEAPLTVKYNDYSNNSLHEDHPTWQQFIENQGYKNAGNNVKCTAMVGNREAEVIYNDNHIILKWTIKELEPGQEITIRYKAQLFLTDEQKKAGGSYEFTNTASYMKRDSSVTVHGGKEKGKLYLIKLFDGRHPYSGDKENNKVLYQEKYGNLTFTLTGVDKQGNAIQFDDGTYEKKVRFNQFEGKNWCAWKLGYEFDNLPVGTYTITESNADIEGLNRTTTYRVDVVKNDGTVIQSKADQSPERATAEIRDFNTTGQVQLVKVDNKYTEPKSVDLQKSVWGIYPKQEWLKDHGDASKEVFDSTATKVITYNITVVNTGKNALTINQLQDQLPEGLTYKGLAENQGALNSKTYTDNLKDAITLNTQWVSIINNKISDVDFSSPTGVTVTATEDTQNHKLNISVSKDGKPVELGEKQLLTFCVVCETNNKVIDSIPMENTAKLIVDEDVLYKDCKEILMRGTPNDKNQNNGSSKDEGVSNGKRTISSSVTILPTKEMIPGITKEAEGYITPGEKQLNNITANSNISPLSAVKWKVTLYNDGVKDMTNYKVSDVVTEPFKLISQEASNKYAIEHPYKYTIYDARGNKQLDEDISAQVWKTLSTTNNSHYEFNFNEDRYKIPAGGYAILEIYTENQERTQYQIYTNTATLIPTQDFNANGVKSGHGELVKNENGKYIGVKASASVNALGEYGTLSWKSITEENNSQNTATGSDSLNYITVDKGIDVIYRNYIKNISGKDYNNVVIIDRLPGLNDTGVVNQQDKRGSEFSVAFANNLRIYKKDNQGHTSLVTDYTVKYSDKVSFTDNEFKGILDNSKWHDTWSATDKSFVVILKEQLKQGETLIYEYKGAIGDDAAPGCIAWNSFGYRYQLEGSDTGIIAEPPKVGVKIPANSPIVKKEVIDSKDQEKEYNATKVFKFRLTGESGNTIAEFNVCQGGYVDLADLTDLQGNPVTLTNGCKYRLQEIDIPTDYQLIGIREDGKDTQYETFEFTYHEKQNLTIIAKNKVNDKEYTLPSTGGTGTTGYLAGGAALMCLAALLYGYQLRRKRERGTM